MNVIREVILRTSGMFDNVDKSEPDFKLWESISTFIDGERALVMKSLFFDDEYVFLALMDRNKDKELHYMLEQDSMTGCFIDDKKKFEAVWDAGEYEKNECWCIKRENIEFFK